MAKYLNKFIILTYNKSCLSTGKRVSCNFTIISGDLCGIKVYLAFQSTVPIQIFLVVSI